MDRYGDWDYGIMGSLNVELCLFGDWNCGIMVDFDVEFCFFFFPLYLVKCGLFFLKIWYGD